MADRAFDRIFSQAVAAVGEQCEAEDPERQRERRQASAEDGMRRMTAGMTAADAITRILLADRDKDYFRMLELPQPELDALGRAAWGLAPADVSRAYRKLSILVHPDKNPGEEARRAFEALNQAHRLLKDAGSLETVLREQLDRAKARRAEAEGRATLEERVVLNAQHVQQAKELRRAEGEALNAEILRQMRDKQERAKQKKEAEEAKGRSRYRRREDSKGGGGDSDDEPAPAPAAAVEDDSDEEDAKRRRLAMAKRRQQQRKASAM